LHEVQNDIIFLNDIIYRQPAVLTNDWMDWIGIVKRFRGGLVFKCRRLLYHSNLGSRAIQDMKICNVWTAGCGTAWYTPTTTNGWTGLVTFGQRYLAHKN
jgi:hypothetical protein